jgi:hypothetical protein
VRGASEHGRQGKGIINDYIQPKSTTATLAAKGMDFLGGIMATQLGCRQEIQDLVRLLSSTKINHGLIVTVWRLY